MNILNNICNVTVASVLLTTIYQGAASSGLVPDLSSAETVAGSIVAFIVGFVAWESSR